MIAVRPANRADLFVSAFWERQSVRYMKHIKEPNRSTLGRVSTLIIGSTVLPQIGMPAGVDSSNRPPSVGSNTVKASQHLRSKADSSNPQLDWRRSRQSRIFRPGIPDSRQLLLYRPFRGSADRSTRASGPRHSNAVRCRLRPRVGNLLGPDRSERGGSALRRLRTTTSPSIRFQRMRMCSLWRLSCSIRPIWCSARSARWPASARRARSPFTTPPARE